MSATPTVSSINQGHEHAANADTYLEQGYLIKAAEEHYKAAEAFKASIEQSTDERSKSTLQIMHAKHLSKGKDLQRRIAKLREEGKDPTQPQLPASPKPAPFASLHYRNAGGAPGSGANSPLRGRNMDSSDGLPEESFMMLNQQAESTINDPVDLFLKVTEEIIQNLSQNTTMSSAAMAALQAVEAREAEKQARREAGLAEAINSEGGRDGRRPSPSQTSQKRPSSTSRAAPMPGSDSDDFALDDSDYDSSDSFCLVPSKSSPGASSSTSRKLLRKENTELKEQVDALQGQLMTMRRQMVQRAEQDQQLKDHILKARSEAQRAIAASTSLAPRQSLLEFAGFNTPPMPGALPGVNRDHEARQMRRIRELEEEIRVLKIESEKQKAMIAKFRDRWERLKESAKRKKSAKAQGQSEATSVRGDRIDEDPEAEAAAEEASRAER